MATHKSAEKRARQAIKRRDRNRGVLTRTRTVTKELRQALEAGDKDLAAERLRLAERELRRAASKGVLPAPRVDRTVSRLARAVGRLS